jgi:apolipoprotein N-acyltransferase
MLLTSIIIVSAVFAFIILGILETDHKKAVAILRVTLLWAVAIYLLIAHAGDAVRMVRTVGGSIEDAKHQSEEKGKNAAKAVKALSTLVEQAGQASSPDSAEPEREKKE